MSWRTVVISSSAKLDYQMGYLIVRNQDVVKVHISEISILMIETTSVSLTAAWDHWYNGKSSAFD